MNDKTKSAVRFYSALIAALAIVAAVTFAAAQRSAQKALGSIDISLEQKSRNADAFTTQTNERVTGIPDERYTLPEIVVNIPDVSEVNEESKDETTLPAQPVISRAESFVMPVSGRIVKNYSSGELVYSNTMGDWRAHTGVDLEAEQGQSVRAVNNGIVKRVYYDELWGNVIEIDHGDGMTARYCPVEADGSIAEGSAVSAGQTIGTLGVLPAEAADGIHLHLEILSGEKYTDPLDAMGKSADDLD